MSLASNTKYLKSLTDQLRKIPQAAAVNVATDIFMEMVTISTIGETGFDSGQAAANWRMEHYFGAPSYDPQRMMWGYEEQAPVAPVGYKSSYAGELEGKPGGDSSAVYVYQFQYATTQAATMPRGISGIVVYNPITPGMPGFGPGDDFYYEENALGTNHDRLRGVLIKGMASGIAKTKVQFPDLLR